MLTLSNGYKKPQTSDKGTALFLALEFNIQRLNDHSHDGLNSNKLNATAFTSVSSNILAAGWAAFGPTGHYRQLVTLPPGLSFDDIAISMRTVAGAYVYPHIEKLSATQYYVHSIDNTLNLVAAYGI